MKNRLLSKLYFCGKFVRRFGARILMYFCVHCGSALRVSSNFPHRSGFGKKSNKIRGFTLVEILIALFIFSILSLMLMTSLRTVINAQSGTEVKAEQLRKLQMLFLIMSRDIEQAVNRPIIQSSGREVPAFMGSPQAFALTHGGFANPAGILAHSTLQRTAYIVKEKILWRVTWPVLDQTPETKSHTRQLMSGVTDVNFSYLDEKGRFHEDWPVLNGEDAQPLPRGVRIKLSLPQGSISQLYLIPVRMNNKSVPSPSPSTEAKKEDDDDA